MDLLIYHGDDCNDGFCCALQAELIWPEIQTLPARYGDHPPDVTGRRVIIADFSYPRDVLLEMHSKAAELIVLDHHKTAQANCEGLDFCMFDMDRCGSRMFFDRFVAFAQPQLLRLFDFINYIQDRDLWKNELHRTDDFTARLLIEPKTFPDWHFAVQLFNKDRDRFLNEGEIINRLLQRQIELSKTKAWTISLSGYEVPCVCNSNRMIASTLLHDLCQRKPFAASFHLEKDQVVVSLRSSEQGVDVSEIAKGFGGGGHKPAAGFSVKGHPQWLSSVTSA